MDTRAPPTEAPPAYARAVTRVYKRDLRPVVIFITSISAIWLVVVGVSNMRYLRANGETSTMKLFDILIGVLAFVLAGIEAFGCAAAVMQRLPLIKTYSFLAFVGACIALAMQVLTIVAHFVLKQPQINQCIGNNQDINNPGSLTNNAFVQQDVSDACNSDWNRQTFYSIAWLIVALIWAFFSTAIAVAYYHQSRDPSYGRSQAPSSAFYRMNPYGQSDPPFQPPPTYGQPYAPYGADGGPPVYAQGDAKLPPQEKNGDGYDMEPGTGDLANRYQENSSEVTLRAADDDDDRDTGRRGEGRV